MLLLTRHLMRLCGIIFSCDQAALWLVQSVCLSVSLSVTPFWLCSQHRISMKFSGVITNERSDVHAKGQGQRSRSQRSTPNLADSGPWLQFEFTYDDEMMHRAWCCLGEVPKAIRQFQGHTAKKIVDFDTNWAFPDCNSSLNSLITRKRCSKLGVA